MAKSRPARPWRWRSGTGQRRPAGACGAAAVGCAEPRVSRQALGNLDRGPGMDRSKCLRPWSRRRGSRLGPGQRAGGFRHPRASGRHPGFSTPSGSGLRLPIHDSSPRASARPRFGVLRTIALYKLVKVFCCFWSPTGNYASRCSLAAKLYPGHRRGPTDWNTDSRSIAGVVQRPQRVAYLRVADRDPGIRGDVRGGGRRLVDGETLGRMADHDHYGFADPARGLGNIFRPTIGKALIILTNIAVVGYLVWHVRKTRHPGILRL